MTAPSDNSDRDAPRKNKPFTTPGIKTAVARHVVYEKPRRFFVQGKETREREGIEVVVEMDAEFPIAGTGPALFIGKVVLIDSERVDGRRYRFFAPTSTTLVEDAALALGRAGSGVPVGEKRTRVRLSWQAE